MVVSYLVRQLAGPWVLCPGALWSPAIGHRVFLGSAHFLTKKETPVDFLSASRQSDHYGLAVRDFSRCSIALHRSSPDMAPLPISVRGSPCWISLVHLVRSAPSCTTYHLSSLHLIHPIAILRRWILILISRIIYCHAYACIYTISVPHFNTNVYFSPRAHSNSPTWGRERPKYHRLYAFIRAEQTASELESRLDSLDSQLDALIHASNIPPELLAMDDETLRRTLEAAARAQRLAEEEQDRQQDEQEAAGSGTRTTDGTNGHPTVNGTSGQKGK
ncbi:hypothetical protein ABW21_db0208245 [Orbilia brochopaga]|nr:hypothetical protein ABW21_db0208245 [Drechslerella brochopaga]